MKKQNGITLIALTITIVVMMILAGITTYFGTDLVKQVKLRDLHTNMLLIQAKAKEYVEEVSFQTANVSDEATKETIKAENLKGSKVVDNSDAKDKLTKTGLIAQTGGDERFEGYYYLTQDDLTGMGLEKLNSDEYGYFIVKYDIENIRVEVINTRGFQGNYTLDQITSLSEE